MSSTDSTLAPLAPATVSEKWTDPSSTAARGSGVTTEKTQDTNDAISEVSAADADGYLDEEVAVNGAELSTGFRSASMTPL